MRSVIYRRVELNEILICSLNFFLGSLLVGKTDRVLVFLKLQMLQTVWKTLRIAADDLCSVVQITGDNAWAAGNEIQ